jgi:hypothetical protein
VLARIVGATADDEDPRRVCQLPEKALHQREMAEVVDAERHLDAILRPLRARHHLDACVAHDRVQRRKSRGANGFHESAHRRQRRKVHRHHRAALRFAQLSNGIGAAAGIANRKDNVPGRVTAQQRSCAFEPEPRAGAGDDRCLRIHLSSNRIGMSAVTT